MKRIYLTTILTSVITLLIFGFFYLRGTQAFDQEVLKVGFIYEDDESTPYTYNFALAENALKETYGEDIQILSLSNVLESETEEPLRDLIRRGCRIIFTNSHSDQFLALAPEYPEIQFCQVSYLEDSPVDVPENYHTFKGEIYQGRYVSGIAAGYKLRDLIDHHDLAPEEALVGYVGANSSAAVISGYTAFLLGIRSVCPEARMKVKYTHAWGNYTMEKLCARELIDEGCIILSQHSDTIGPAIACEEAAANRQIYFVGYNQSMLDVAPTTALISTRINWSPYIREAVQAVMNQTSIEKTVSGNVHNGNDISAGFDLGWVEMLDLNTHIAADGTQKKMDEAIEALNHGTIQVFQGDYTGVNPDDPADTCDLNQGFAENASSSSPAFHYILQDMIEVEE